MSEFKITGPGFYKVSGGMKAEVVGRVSTGVWLGIVAGSARFWWEDGSCNNVSADRLIAPWTEPKKGTVWVNVFQRQSGKIGFAGYFASRAEADANAALARVSVRIACVSVNWTEGEGL